MKMLHKKLLLPLLLGGFALAQASAQTAAPQVIHLTGEFAGTHDPSIGVDHGKYYVFATGTAYAPPVPGSKEKPRALGQFPIRCSTDLHEWKRCGEVFPGIPEWIKKLSPKTPELWAPDISYFDGLYHLYYAFSVFGKNTSGIALATNETLDASSPKYKWLDRGLVLQSKLEDNFNAIDPNLVLDSKGEAWLSFGSFWSGIKMRHLDRKTGMLSTSDTKLYSLASRAPAPTTAPRNPDLPPDNEAHRSALHPQARRVLLPLRLLGPLLPWSEEQLQNDGGPIKERHRPLPRPQRQRHDAGRGIAPARR